MNDRLHTFHHACGCISQRKANSSSRLWVYCGNETCPFDELGTHRKHKPVPQSSPVKPGHFLWGDI